MYRYIASYVFAGLIILFGCAVLLAQTPTPTPPPTDVQKVKPEGVKGVPEIGKEFKKDDKSLPDIGRVGVNMLNQKPLTLRNAIVKGLESNIDIEVTRQDVKIAEFDLQAASGSFEPRFTGQTFFNRSTTPNISIFSQNTSNTVQAIGGNARYQGFLQNSGGSYFAEFSNQRQTTNNPISILSPQDNTAITVGIVQPLIKGRKTDERRRAIAVAKKNLSLTDAQFRQKAIEITSNIQLAYWDLTFALKNLQVQRDGVRDAKEQLEHNKRLVKEGVLAPVDILAAETQVANLELQVYSSLETVNRAENLLKGLLSGDRQDSVWKEALIPTDKLELRIPRVTLNEAVKLALENRPELDTLDVAKEINAINERFFKDQEKPQVDFTASYSTSGVSGGFNNSFDTPFLPGACDNVPITDPACQAAVNAQNAAIRQSAEVFTGGPQSSFTDLVLNRYPTFSVGITFDLPLFGNKTNRANLARNQVEGQKIETQRKQLEQLIMIDVRNALQAIRTSEARLRSAAISRENSEKQYESEKRKLDAGLSDIYKVLERQTALMNARSIEIQAQTQLNKAIANLERATGNSLKANDLETRLKK